MQVAKIGVGIALGGLVACASGQPKPAEPTWIPPPPLSTTAMPQLLQSLSSQDTSARAAAAWRLAQLPRLQSEALAALEAHRTDPDRSVRYAVAWAVGCHVSPGQQDPADNVEEGTPPRPTHTAKPRYPDEAYRDKLQGTVVVAILIGEEGEVAYAEVVRSNPAFDAAALACVRQWRFEPMRVAGTPRATVAHAPVTFRIY